jgi:hypothetical protein
MKKFYTLFLFVLVIFLNAGAQFDGEKVVFYVGSSGANDAEKAVSEKLEAMGMVVAVINVYDPADIPDADLLLISGTVNSGDVATPHPDLGTYDLPIINCEPALYDELGVSESGGSSFTAVDGNIEIVDEEHPLAAELAGTVQITEISKDVTGGQPEGDVNIVAMGDPADPAKACIFSYNLDAMMRENPAPAKRVGFFLMNDAADAMTDQGWALFEAAVLWSMDLLHGTSIFDPLARDFEISVYPNPSSGIIELSFASENSQTAVVYITDLTGKEVMHKVYAANGGMNHLRLDASELREGLYLYSVQMNNQVAAGKLLITE